jgi:hypothetical protein
VPEGDVVLSDTPAEQHFLALPLGREVDEAFVEILHERSDLVDPRNAASDSRRPLAKLLLEVAQLARVEVASVAGDLLGEGRVPRLQLRESTPALDHLLGQGPDDGERLVRLVRGEVPCGHADMIGAS